MSEAILVAVLSLCGTLIGSVAGILAAQRLTAWRLKALEDKVSRHNNLVEKVVVLEKNSETCFLRLDELREGQLDIRHELTALRAAR